MQLTHVWLVHNPDPLVISHDPTLETEEDRIGQFCRQVSVVSEELFSIWYGTICNPHTRDRWSKEKTVLYTEEKEAKTDAAKRLAKLRKRYTCVWCSMCNGRGTVGDYPNGDWDRCHECHGSGHAPKSV